MPHITESIEIDAPQDALWDFINDFDRMTDWVTFADDLLYVSEGEIGVGTIYREYGGVGPIESESEWEITAFDPPRQQVHVGDLGIMTPELTMTLEEHNGGTLFTQELEFTALPAVRPLGWLLERIFIIRAMQSGLEATQRNLKTLVETEFSDENL